ncbi:MAG: Gfo/Idh/MocA family oxidoreductase [Phycisphaeraceae bacterium]|nr:Gfo/Idh/MocA family oxidoreductase [Phycisphaeraceae bacterium]
MNKVKTGIIGCGNISGNYLINAKKFPILEITTLADLDLSRARERAKEHNIPKAVSVDELLRDSDIELVINLTVPQAHGPIALRAIEAGKHVLNEKPFAVTRDEGRQVLTAAAAKKLLTGGAPDTFLGAAHQTARKLIDDGAIGRPVAATAYMMCRGHEGWHPDPEFFYKNGGGPMFDMGPYYITDLLQLLGPAKRVAALTSIAIPERTIGSEPKRGQKIKVETPDHLAGTIEFHNGCLATVIMSFAVIGAQYPSPITIFGTEGTLAVPDPNHFDGVVKLMKLGQKEYTEVPLTHRAGYGRSVGAADLAYSIRSGRIARASGEQAYAVLDIMQAFIDAGQTGKAVELQAKYERPKALPTGLAEGELDR